jgi:tripartite-type tricarboxylate transporter receptor subunit TctC
MTRLRLLLGRRVGNRKDAVAHPAPEEAAMARWSGISPVIGALLLMALVAMDPARAQDAVAQFYKGKQINLYVGSSAGGGYDTYARLLARRFGSYIPGNPTVVPQNMPGAGSNKLASYIYSVAPKDGTAIGAIFSGAILQPLLGDPVQHDPAKFIYLGNANNEVFLCLARSDAPVQSFKEALSRELIVGATNEGGSSRDFTAMLDNLLGARLRIVTGYLGSNEILLALERNEVQGVCGLGWSSIAPQRARLLDSGLARVLVQLATTGHPELNKMSVPLAIDFSKSEDDRKVMELVYSQLIFGRPFILPPGVPAERVAALRRAFMAALRDKDALAEARGMQLDLDPLAGEAVQAEVAKAYGMPGRIVERAKQSLVYRPQ